MQASVISLVPVPGAGKAGQGVAFANTPSFETGRTRRIFQPDEILAGDTVTFFHQSKRLRGFVQQVDEEFFTVWFFNHESNSNEKVYLRRNEVRKWKK